MPLDWLNTPLDVPIGELIARKKRAQTIDMLRTQLQGRLAPGVQVRLQLADLLVQAGRVSEAVPVLIGLADEFAGDGFVAKAIAILKRIEKVEGGRADVETRIARLVQQQQRSVATGAGAASGRGDSRMPDFGIEEFTDEPVVGFDAGVPTDSAPRETAITPESEDVTREEGPAASEPMPPPEGAAAVPHEGIDPDPPPAASPVDEEPAQAETEVPTAPAPTGATPDIPVGGTDVLPVEAEGVAGETVAAAVVDEAAPARPSAGVARRLKGAFRRFLAALPGSGDDSPPATPSEAGDEATAEAFEDAPPSSDSAGTSPDASPVAPPSPIEPAPAAETDPVTVAAAGMTDEVFEEHLLDIVQDVLKRPVQPPKPPSAMDRGRVLEYAERLLATPLLATLSEEELLAVVQGLRVVTAEPGDVIVTEGGPGEGLFILSSGAVRIFVRSPSGRNFEVAALLGGDFFGEISSLSGRARTATVVAAASSDLLELDKATLDTLARSHPRVCLVLENAYVQRATSPEAAAIRAVPVSDAEAQRRADAVLQAHFGEKQWDPRMRLRLADVLVRTGKVDDAVHILTDLADDLAREGYTEKAIAILKKIERLRGRDIEEVSLAPLLRIEAEDESASLVPSAPGLARAGRRARTDEFFHGWLLDVARDAVGRRKGPAGASEVRPEGSALGGYARGLVASPLFEGFAEDELLALIQGLRLISFEPGEMIVSEGEPGESLFILATGAVKVFVRTPESRDALVCTLDDGAFFGEIAALSGQRRSATVTAAAPSELLELDRPTLDAISERHPGVRRVLEEASQRRVTDPTAVALRRGEAPPLRGSPAG